MHLVLNVLLVILVIAVIALAVLYFLGRKLEKRQVEQQQLLEMSKQTVSMLVIDKKKMKIKESGLPKIVYEQTPKYMRWAKVPVVKAKVGPKVMTLLADEDIDVALLPIGDFYTMGPADALRAVKLIRPRLTVPMHYNTFQAITQDPEAFAAACKEVGFAAKVLQPGEEMTL